MQKCCQDALSAAICIDFPSGIVNIFPHPTLQDYDFLEVKPRFTSQKVEVISPETELRSSPLTWGTIQTDHGLVTTFLCVLFICSEL